MGKSNLRKLLIPLLLIAVLAGAFWYGGNAPGLRGWTVESDPTPMTTPSSVPDLDAEQGGEPSSPGENTAPGDGPEQTVTPESVAPSPEGEETPAPNPSQTVPADGEEPPPEASREPDSADRGGNCTISISCAVLLDHLDWLDEEKVELVPEDGWILPAVSVRFEEGESVFDVLRRVCREEGIHLEFENTPAYNSAYIEGINNLYEFDCGERSGWMYKVNESFPNYGSSLYTLENGDVIGWVYTCDLGADVGGAAAAGG